MDLTPYQDGVMLTYYHGAWVSHTQAYSTTVYITCQSGTTQPPSVEHMKTATYNWHISIPTQAYSTTVYITCQSGTTQPPSVEHMKTATYNWHISIPTPVVC
eukprot:TRINITY_DN930_c0_g1_i2.p1 TRINITY_DN930_c0_g1~~TRINITY_DN930_c0_g1_i2.p1  ORF type:complete len:102 (+),score=15.66 TRINITY_DN930_c0_g1_i2:360-665(+)